MLTCTQPTGIAATPTISALSERTIPPIAQMKYILILLALSRVNLPVEAGSIRNAVTEGSEVKPSTINRNLEATEFCTQDKCKNGGTCNAGDKRCTCQKVGDYSPFIGRTCQKDWCTTKNSGGICLNGGTCTFGDTKCVCKDFFYGRRCRHSCTDPTLPYLDTTKNACTPCPSSAPFFDDNTKQCTAPTQVACRYVIDDVETYPIAAKTFTEAVTIYFYGCNEGQSPPATQVTLSIDFDVDPTPVTVIVPSDGIIFQKVRFTASGSLKFDGGRVWFKDNRSDIGGAILNQRTVTFTGPVAFTGNSATASGGAIYVSGTVHLQSSSYFHGNSAINSGAINGAGYITFAGVSNFISNTATGQGGGMYIQGGVFSFQQLVRFTDNTAATHGGAASLSYPGNINCGATTDNSCIKADACTSPGGNDIYIGTTDTSSCPPSV